MVFQVSNSSYSARIVRPWPFITLTIYQSDVPVILATYKIWIINKYYLKLNVFILYASIVYVGLSFIYSSLLINKTDIE